MNFLATKKDYYIVSIIGLSVGLLSLPVLENIRPSFWQLTFLNALELIIGFWLLANAALWIGSFFGRKFIFLWQFTKFGAVGTMNAFLDFGIINLLSLIFKIYAGSWLALFNVISGMVAITNSYLLNKFWSFGHKEPVQWKEIARFICVTLGTVFISTFLVYILTTVIGAPQSISEPLWENIAKIIAVPVTLLLNFVGYKYFVFKR